jgi:hypothetical protein
MKKLSTGILKVSALLLFGLFSLFTNNAKGSEFVIMNRVISWDVNAQDAFWSIMPDATMPTNWLTPNDYYNGKIYTRYEVLSVATNVRFGMQFGIFQWNPSRNQRLSCGELCEFIRPLQGVGDVAINSSTPATWWKDKGGVDFARVVDFESMAAVIYSWDTQYPVGKPGEGGDPAGISWSQRFNWFPVTIRITVVAVSNGSVFSGWDNYIINPALRQSTPTYEIDYINETTDNVVPSTDQFSIYSGMSGAIDGNDQKMPITPGQDANFRTKAGGGLLVSEVQHFRAPCRPATPAFLLDKVNNRTTTLVNSDYEYSDFADMSGAITGSGTYVVIPAGTTKYFRKKATISSFKSNVQALTESTILPIAHELLLINDTIDFPNSTDTNGFYYFYYNADMPVNWRTPDDYYFGEVFVRYEIISQKTEAQIGLQFGIWQMMPPETGELHETMSELVVMNGTGSTVVTNSSPYTWWKLDPWVDFTKMNMTWHFGINPWQVTPSSRQIRQENPTVWANRFTNWFPMKVYVTVIAVAADRTFSGWENYINTNPGSKKPMPAFGIDYIIGQTNSVVPATIEYSINANMSDAVNGDGQNLALTPGQDVYFRTKAGGGLYASDIQHLVVPTRPVAPSVTIDFVYERTVQNITSDIEYAATDSFTSVLNGTSNKINVVPGHDLYFRKKATETFFTSETFHLVSPSRPATPSFSVDFINEVTTQNVNSDIVYSTSSSYTNPVNGTGAKVSLTPGQDLYLWVKETSGSFASMDYHLVVPNRPATSAFSIDFSNEKTVENISSGISYTTSASFTSPITGTGIMVTLTPGQDLYFRMNATSGSFNSAIQHLIVPARPSIPNISINYINENTSAVASTLEWSENASLSTATQGLNASVSLVPGTDLYFRQKATSGSFKSDVQHLDVPIRPSAPGISISYFNENTATIPSSIEWSGNASLSPATQGQDISVAVTPGNDLYFRTKATSGTFKSIVQHLVVPNRPSTPSYSINYQQVKTNEPVVVADDYSTNSDLTDASAGTNSLINLTPGTDIYFRTRATSSSFGSAVQYLTVPDRPSTPVYTINYLTGTTNESCAADIAYSTNPNFAFPTYGNGEVVTLEPAQDIYFKQSTGGTSFSSDVFHLVVPGQNYLGYSGADTITSDKFVVYAILAEQAAVLSLDDLEITNGTALNLRQGNVFDVYPGSNGLVSVIIPANTITDNSFASNEVTVYYGNTATGIPELTDDGFLVYPNPSNNGILFIKTALNVPYIIGIYAVDGSYIKSFDMNNMEYQQINLQDLHKGVYILKINSIQGVSTRKIVLN